MMQVYAHRAGRGLAPENTLYACQTAIELGVDFIDFDIGMTKDGMLVVTHDVTLNPAITRDSFGTFIAESTPIYALTYQELLSFNVGQINPSAPYASYFPYQVQIQHAHIPLLQEAIDYVQSIAKNPVGFQIEIKIDPQLTAPPEVFAHALYKILQESKIVECTEVQSFDYRCLLNLQKLDSQIKTAYLTLNNEEALSKLHTAGHNLEDFEHSFPKLIKALGGSCWGPYQMDVRQTDIEEAKKLGLKIVPWGYPEKEGTEFNHAQIAKLMGWGVDGIITDRPDLLRKLLNESA